MSIWLPMSGPYPLHSYMLVHVPQCDPFCMFQSPLSGSTRSLECVHDYPYLLHPLCIAVCKYVLPCVIPYACSTHSSASAIPWLEYEQTSVHVFMSTWLPKNGSIPFAYFHANMYSLVWPFVYIPFTLHLDPHLGYYVYMHQYVYPCPSDSPCQLHPLCIVTCKHGCSVCPHVSSARPPFPGPILWLEYVNASAHVCMSTWLSMSSQLPFHSCMQICVFLCGPMWLSDPPSSHYTPCLEYVHAPVCIHVHLTAHVSSKLTPAPLYLHTFRQACAPLCGLLCVSHSPLIWSLIFLACIHASVHVCISTWLPTSVPHPLHNCIPKCVSLCCPRYVS